MSKTEEFILQEIAIYGKIYSDIAFAISNVSGFLDKGVFNNRKYVSRQPVLNKYIDLLNAAKAENKKGGFFQSILGNDKYINLLSDYKFQHKKDFEQLEHCSKCECLNCTADCKFDSCNGCIDGAKIPSCDHKKANVFTFDYRTLDLRNDKTGQDDKYNVLAIVQDAENDKRYIFIENLRNSERFILYYYPGISEDTYEEITNENDFNFAAGVYENIER